MDYHKVKSYRTLEEIPGYYIPNEQVVLRDIEDGRFRIADLNEYCEWHAMFGGGANHHEIVLKNVARKLMFDVDGDTDEDLSRQIDDLKFAIIEVYADLDLQLDSKDIIVASRNRPGKRSYHIIVDKYCFSKADTKTLWLRIAALAPSKWYDVSKKTIGSMSIVGCRNKGHLLRMETDHCLKQSLLTYTQDCEFVDLGSKEEEVDAPLAIGAILELADKIPYIGDHRFLKQNGKYLNFSRVRNGHCRLCNKQHERDNTLYLICLQGKVYEGCIRAHGKTMLIGECENEVEMLLKTFQRQEPAEHIWMEPLQERDYAIKAPMGCGKTHQVIELLKRHPNARVLILSTRVSFTNSIMARLANLGFQSYTDVKGTIGMDVKRLILQIESLHRLAWDHDAIDFLIVDESETVKAQLVARTVKRKRDVVSTFASLLQNAKRRVLMDANMSQQTLELFQRFGMPALEMQVVKPAGSRHSMFVHHTKETLLKKLYDMVEAGRNVSIVHLGGVAEMEALKRDLTREFPDLNVLTIHSESPMMEKAAFFAQPTKPDVLIMSPTAGPGVDIVYEQPHFDVQFALLNNMGADYLYVRQMLRRVRQLRLHETHLYIDHQLVCRPLSISALVEKIEHRVQEFQGNLSYENGRVRVHMTPFNELLLQIELLRNTSAMHFTELLLRGEHEANPAMCFEYVREPVQTRIAAAVKKEVKQVKLDNDAALAAAPQLNDAEWMALQKRFEKHDMLTPVEILALRKKNMETAFGVPITKEFLAAYTKPIRRNYFNLKYRNGTQELRECVEGADGVSKTEVEILIETKDIKKKLCNEMLNVLGAGGKTNVMRDSLVRLLTPEMARKIAMEFDKRPLKSNDLVNMLRFVNPVLQTTYGYSYKATDTHHVAYKRVWALDGIVSNGPTPQSNGKFMMPVLEL